MVSNVVTPLPLRTIILIPVFNDWEPAHLLLDELDRALIGNGMKPEVLFVDDGSTSAVPAEFGGQDFAAIRSIDILRLRRNLGHQRAIAAGLVYVYQNLPCEAVLVMDADGQDRPEDIPALVGEFEKLGRKSIVFAARSKRLEGLLFRLLYGIYRFVHLLLTGDAVRVGNFSLIPAATLSQLVVIPEIWNHYAAAAIRSRLTFRMIPIPRGKRLAGSSKMNFIGLLLHGLSAFFVYGDIVGARLLVGIAIALMVQIAVAAGLVIHFTARPDFAIMVAVLAGLLSVVLLQAIPVALILVFTVVGSRATIGVVPLRDCPYFVDRMERIFGGAEKTQ